MHKSTFSRDGAFDEEVVFCLERQMIPAWERFGLEHLSVSAPTLREFNAQSLPEYISTWKKKRVGKKVALRSGRRGNPRVIEQWPQDDLHSIRFPVLIFVRSGQAEIPLGDYVARCPQGHFLLMTAGVPMPAGALPHLEAPREDKECEIWWFHGSGNEDECVALSVCYSVGNQHSSPGHYYIVENPRVARLLHFFNEEMQERPENYKKTAFASLQMFLLLFLRDIKRGRFHDRGIDTLPKSARSSPSPIEMALTYIDRNLNQALTLDVVAQAVFMARTNFVQQFRRETGKTFREYLTERRLEEAKHWLRNDAWSVRDVCVLVGLKSSQFHDLFQRRFGMTPLEFRRKNKNV
jgi:AraC-like DNA-binding protein